MYAIIITKYFRSIIPRVLQFRNFTLSSIGVPKFHHRLRRSIISRTVIWRTDLISCNRITRLSSIPFDYISNSPSDHQKSQLKIMKLDNENFRSLFTPELQYLAHIFKKYNYELRLAGGAVRDLLMDILPADLDFATTATPQEMYDMFTKECVRMLNKKGEKHGTVTCRIHDKENFEITTLRVDVVCDGRHAEVEFTTDWFKDASRRDLTVNAMYLDLDGQLYDYFAGVEDLKNRRIVFVGRPEERIREDYLRILRYFRFYGRLAVSPNDHQPETLKAIKETASGLAGISGERIWMELRKIITGRFSGPNMRQMVDCGVTPYLGFPTFVNLDEFERITEATMGMDPKPMTLIAALLLDESEISQLDKRVRMSVAERLLGLYVVNHRNENFDQDESMLLKHFQDSLLDEKFRPSSGGDGEERILELLKYLGKRDLLEKLRQWSLTKPQFPINGNVLFQKAKMRPGKRMKEALEHLFNCWKSSSYEYNQEQLLNEFERWREERRVAGDRSPSPPLQKKGRTAT